MTPMIRLLASFLAALLTAQTAGAAATHVALPSIQESIVIPDGSTLAFKSFDKAAITVHFAGQVQLSGTYYFGNNVYEDASSGQAAYFKPDPASMARLPYFKERGRPDDIFLSNPAAFQRAVVRHGTVPRKSTPYATGHITIIVDRFEASIECDAPSFPARFVSVVKPAPVRMAATPDTGC
jgi:hypothetical protein